MSTRDLTLVATLGGLAAAGRVLFAPIPSVQPVTVIVAAVGRRARPATRLRRRRAGRDRVELLPRPGPAHAVADARLGRLRPARRPAGGRVLRRRLAFAAFVLVLGFAFGMLMDVWLWFAFYPHTEAALLARLAAGVAVQRRARGRERRARARRRAGAATRARAIRTQVREPRWSGREAARRHSLRRGARDPGGLRPGQQRDDGGFGDRADHGLGDARARRGRRRTRARAAEYLARSRADVRDRRVRCSRWPARRRATGRTTCSPRLRAYRARQARQRDDLDDPGAAAGRRAGAAGAREGAPRRRSGRTAAGRGSPAAPPTRTTRPPRSRRSARRA